MFNADTLHGRFDLLDSKRSAVLARGRSCSELTIPGILPQKGHNEASELPTPYQSLGARGANNLASKLLLALLPPNASFFRLMVDDKTVVELTGDPDMKAEVEMALGKVEQTVNTHLESTNIRPVLFEALKHLIIVGNCLLLMPKEGGMRVLRLDQYVVRRDPAGNVLEIITLESVSPLLLEDEVCAACGVDKTDDQVTSVDIYTQYLRTSDSWEMVQELKGKEVPGTKGKVPYDQSPAIALRYSATAGENYGRGLAEEYLGDLRSLEGLTKSIVIAAAASAKILFLLAPNGSTQQKDLEKESGSVVIGTEKDVSVLQVQKHADLRVAREVTQDITMRLAQAFLLNASVQRDAERVTAEEIRMMAQELEDALGGVYSVLAQELQLPVVKRFMAQMKKQGKLPQLPKDVVQPVITTGLEALGRGHDIAKLRAVLEDLAPLGEETIKTYLNVPDYITRVVTARGVDSSGLIRSEQEVQQIQQQNQMAAMAQSVAPGVATEVTKQMGNQAPQGES